MSVARYHECTGVVQYTGFLLIQIYWFINNVSPVNCSPHVLHKHLVQGGDLLNCMTCTNTAIVYCLFKHNEELNFLFICTQVQ